MTDEIIIWRTRYLPSFDRRIYSEVKLSGVVLEYSIDPGELLKSLVESLKCHLDKHEREMRTKKLPLP